MKIKKFERFERFEKYIEPYIVNKKYLKFKLNSTKRTVFINDSHSDPSNIRYFLQFPEMEFKIPYHIHKNKATLFFPHYDLKFVYNNKKYLPYLPNSVKIEDAIKYCTNSDLYKYSFSFEKLDDVKNFIIINFFNTKFNESIRFIKESNWDIEYMLTNRYFTEWQELSKNGVTQELIDFISFKNVP